MHAHTTQQDANHTRTYTRTLTDAEATSGPGTPPQTAL